VSANKGQAFMGLALFLGVAAAAVGFVGLRALATQNARATNAAMRDVVIVKADQTFGTRLDKNMLAIVKYPKDAVPSGAYATMDSVLGQTTKVFMSAREPVTALKLSARGGGLSVLVRPTLRAASLEVNYVSSVSGFVLPGDRVDVLVTVDRVNQAEDAFTHTILQNLEVLAAGPKTSQQGSSTSVTGTQKVENSGAIQAVTVLVDPKGAQQLAHAQHEGLITLVLRNPEDSDTLKVADFTSRELTGRSAMVAAVRRTAAREHKVAPPETRTVYVEKKPEPPTSVRIYRGSSLNEVPVPKDTTTN
jgi:pilus assembly protein CpaB